MTVESGKNWTMHLGDAFAIVPTLTEAVSVVIADPPYGMRLDAIPYLCERDGTNNENLPETHAVLRSMRAELDRLGISTVSASQADQAHEVDLVLMEPKQLGKDVAELRRGFEETYRTELRPEAGGQL